MQPITVFNTRHTFFGGPITVFLPVQFFCAMLQSGPSHQAMCTYCRSHALTSLKRISLFIMLCSTVGCAGACLFMMKVLSFFFFFLSMFIIGRYFSDVFILMVHLNVRSVWYRAEYANTKFKVGQKSDCWSQEHI